MVKIVDFNAIAHGNTLKMPKVDAGWGSVPATGAVSSVLAGDIGDGGRPQDFPDMESRAFNP